MGESPRARRAFPPHWAGLDTWPRLGKPNQGKQWMVPGASRGEGSAWNASTELGTVLQPRGEEGAALGAGLCPQGWHFSAQWVPEVMETPNLTCLHPPPHPRTQQNSRNAPNSQLTTRQEILATKETSSLKTITSLSSCDSREEETSLPHPAEQLGASWEYHPCWEQSSGCILGTGRAGRRVSFFK